MLPIRLNIVNPHIIIPVPHYLRFHSGSQHSFPAPNHHQRNFSLPTKYFLSHHPINSVSQRAKHNWCEICITTNINTTGIFPIPYFDTFISYCRFHTFLVSKARGRASRFSQLFGDVITISLQHTITIRIEVDPDSFHSFLYTIFFRFQHPSIDSFDRSMFNFSTTINHSFDFTVRRKEKYYSVMVWNTTHNTEHQRKNS